MQKILVVGSSNMDMVAAVDSIPAKGETVMGLRLDKIPGGKGANQAYACAMLGGSTEFISMLGDDDLGALLRSNMRAAGVATSRIGTASGVPTGTAFIWVDRHGHNSIVVIQGANAGCDSDYIQRNVGAFADCDLLLVQMETPEQGVHLSIRLAAARHKTVILNPAPAPEDIPDDIWQLLDYITPNETELYKLSGVAPDSIEAVEEGCQRLLKKGVKNVLVTLGGKGAMLVNRSGSRLFAPPQVQVVDTTAAGDTFNAAFAVRLLEGAPPEQAIVFANAASSLAVSRKGAQTSVPSRDEVEQFLQSL